MHKQLENTVQTKILILKFIQTYDRSDPKTNQIITIHYINFKQKLEWSNKTV